MASTAARRWTTPPAARPRRRRTQAQTEAQQGREGEAGRQPDQADVVADLRRAEAQQAAGVIGRAQQQPPGEQRGVALRQQDRMAERASSAREWLGLGGRGRPVPLESSSRRRRSAPPSASWAAGRGRSRFLAGLGVAVLGRHLAGGRPRQGGRGLPPRSASVRPYSGHQCAHLGDGVGAFALHGQFDLAIERFPCAATVPGLHGWPFDTPGNSSFRRADSKQRVVFFCPRNQWQTLGFTCSRPDRASAAPLVWLAPVTATGMVRP